jgi:hypothetical protein
MIECIFTVDYEIYGNGFGSLEELVFKPMQKLEASFKKVGAKIVVFVEVAELEKIEKMETDLALNKVKKQVRKLYEDGHEIALHIHPQWCKAHFEDGKWVLDNSEYNLCALSEDRIAEIIDGSIEYLSEFLGNLNFKPNSFRAGNWLFQPTKTVARVLVNRGIKVDSSVFKGGVQHQHKLDYRIAKKNGYFWKFQEKVNTPDNSGELLEVPIYTQMVPFWKLITTKRVSLQQKAPSDVPTIIQRINRFKDIARLTYPLKFDFCRMTMKELVSMLDRVIKEDKKDPDNYKPIVAIGHTKDLIDIETVEKLLIFLNENGITVGTFYDVMKRFNNSNVNHYSG